MIFFFPFLFDCCWNACYQVPLIYIVIELALKKKRFGFAEFDACKAWCLWVSLVCWINPMSQIKPRIQLYFIKHSAHTKVEPLCHTFVLLVPIGPPHAVFVHFHTPSNLSTPWKICMSFNLYMQSVCNREPTACFFFKGWNMKRWKMTVGNLAPKTEEEIKKEQGGCQWKCTQVHVSDYGFNDFIIASVFWCCFQPGQYSYWCWNYGLDCKVLHTIMARTQCRHIWTASLWRW